MIAPAAPPPPWYLSLVPTDISGLPSGSGSYKLGIVLVIVTPLAPPLSAASASNSD
jgi:hypothetical protein